MSQQSQQSAQQSGAPESIDELMARARDLAAVLHDTITAIEEASGTVIDRAAFIDAMSDDEGEPLEGITPEVARAILARCDAFAGNQIRRGRAGLH